MSDFKRTEARTILPGLSKKEVIRVALHVYGFDWCRAAMVHGSIGYYTASSAGNAIKCYQSGIELVSERCAACYNGDFELMLTCDFLKLEDISLDRQRKVIEQVKTMDEMSEEAQLSVSMLYPTHYYV